MQILHLSDTHNQHRQLGNLPAADVIIHSGDITFAGTGDEVLDFIEWFGSLSYQYKIFIAGNHDYALEGKAPERIQRSRRTVSIFTTVASQSMKSISGEYLFSFRRMNPSQIPKHLIWYRMIPMFLLHIGLRSGSRISQATQGLAALISYKQ
jgi:predicted phosphodiesterase